MCSGQLKLATVLEFSQYSRSDSLGVRPPLYQSDEDSEFAFVKLLEHGRPNAVIGGMSRNLFDKKDINLDLACEALLALAQSEDQAERIDSYRITKIIKYLQENDDTNKDKLFQVEWAYVSMLDRRSEGSPVTLENRLASTPSFFCKLIQLIYRAEGTDQVDVAESTEQSRILPPTLIVCSLRGVPFQALLQMECSTLMHSQNG